MNENAHAPGKHAARGNAIGDGDDALSKRNVEEGEITGG